MQASKVAIPRCLNCGYGNNLEQGFYICFFGHKSLPFCLSGFEFNFLFVFSKLSFRQPLRINIADTAEPKITAILCLKIVRSKEMFS